ncbi:MAG: DUF1993 domain-containing protein [Gammaproteobacteria bacterium]
MALSMYELSVPVFERALKNLSHVLKKGTAHAEAAKIDPGVLIGARLYPNMFPLAKQVQIATDLAARGASRLAGREPPSFPDTEQSFSELQTRIEKARACLQAIEPAHMEDAENRSVEFKAGGEMHTLSAPDYLMAFVLPNLYFHVTTAYAILRHNGVGLGKSDYLGTD